ncbi:hypothetical protein BBH99_04010 [Chryseobacterium contaminans]|uniref:Uncharacterized protein n=1 Tax=Chryseobacterium contaminans TaxID=1423959 RepID=A0A1M7A162_9FLAO|nr:hypothetical protein [Chryseobacterium contaminans]OCA80498.1 hypothetical protein BBH99_04010 [Chryseobacterium contaminans]SHL36457.1 hypothetical protein SAMN05444407_103446 [Chryseobacterium contaminans]
MPQNIPSGSLSTAPDSKGLNVRPDLLPESFFFLEKGKTFTQSLSEKFGANGTVFRTTSKINGYTGKVYTICQGQVFLQPCGTDTTKVNAILKPFNQPIKGLAIKYIVYRGLNRSDFFQGDLITSGTPTTFVDIIKKEFTGLYNMLGIAVPQFTAQHIGFPVGNSQLETDLIDDYFLKISKVEVTGGTATEQPKKAFELPMIPRGTHLGNVTGSVGIDIVLNEGDYTIANDPNPFQLNLAFARSADHVLDQAVGNTAFKKKLIRETATQFLDIAAFYGLHTQGKGKIYMSDNSVLQTVEEIASQISGFKTADTTYLYIQGSRQRSYNFYGNQNLEGSTNNIKIGPTTANLALEQFEAGWPVKELAAQPSLVVQLTTDNNDAAAMYVKQGVLHADTRNEDYFIRGKNLLQEEGNGADMNFTKPITFKLDKTSAGKTVASFIQLIYEGKTIVVEENTVSNDPNIPSQVSSLYMKDIDDIFGLINVFPKIKSGTNYEQKYVIDQNLLLIDFENKTGQPDIATVTTKRVEDTIVKEGATNLMRITYETLLNNIRQNMGAFFENRTAYSDNSNSGTRSFEDSRNNFYQPEKPYSLKKEVFEGIEGTIINALSLYLEDGALPSKKILGVTYDENEKLIELINFHTLNNPKFFFKSDLQNNGYYTSKQDTKYRKYYLAVVGEDNAGALKIVTPTPKIYVSTVDNLVFSTDEYAKWTPVIEQTVNNNIYEKIKN